MRRYLLPTHEKVTTISIYNHVNSDDVRRVKRSTRDGRDLLAKNACLPSKFRIVPTRRNIHTVQGIEMDPDHTLYIYSKCYSTGGTYKFQEALRLWERYTSNRNEL